MTIDDAVNKMVMLIIFTNEGLEAAGIKEKKFGTFQIPVDSFNETSGGGRMVIATSNRYDSSTSTTNQRQNDEVYETP